VSMTGYVFVDDRDLARVAGRLGVVAGPLARRSDDSFESAKRELFVRHAKVRAEGFERFPTVLIVRDYYVANESELRELIMRAFSALRAAGDVAIVATLEMGETLATFEPKTAGMV